MAGWVVRRLIVFAAVIATLVGMSCSPAWAAAKQGTLRVRVLELPRNAKGAVSVRGAGRSWLVGRTRTLRVPAGRYRHVARIATIRGARYIPRATHITVRVRAAHKAVAVVDYATIVPKTTKTPTPAAVVSVGGDPGGLQTLALAKPAGGSYAHGDVIALGVSSRTPDGLLVKVVKVASQTSSTQTLQVEPATLPEAIPRGVFDAHIASVAFDPSQASRLSNSGKRKLTGLFSQACGAESELAAEADAGVTASLDAHVAIGGHIWSPKITSASFTLSATARAGASIHASASASCSVSRTLFDLDGAPIDVQIGPVPVVFVPHYGADISISGSYEQNIDAGASIAITGRLGVAYDGSHWRPVSEITRTFDKHLTGDFGPSQPLQVDARVSGKVGFRLYGLAGPYASFGFGPSVTATPLPPSLALTGVGTVSAGVDIDIKKFGFGYSAHAEYPILNISEPLATFALSAAGGGTGGGGTPPTSPPPPPTTPPPPTPSVPRTISTYTTAVDLSCGLKTEQDNADEFYGGGGGVGDACGTFLALNGTLYGPASIPAGGNAAPRTSWTPISQDAHGQGTAQDPYVTTTVVAAGDTGVQLAETDTWTAGGPSVDTQMILTAPDGDSDQAVLYRAADCYVADSDTGIGALDTATHQVSCQQVQADGATLSETLLPLSPGAQSIEGRYSNVWTALGTQQPFAESCDCTTDEDNGFGTSWTVTLTGAAPVALSSRYLFSLQ